MAIYSWFTYQTWWFSIASEGNYSQWGQSTNKRLWGSLKEKKKPASCPLSRAANMALLPFVSMALDQVDKWRNKERMTHPKFQVSLRWWLNATMHVNIVRQSNSSLSKSKESHTWTEPCFWGVNPNLSWCVNPAQTIDIIIIYCIYSLSWVYTPT